MRRVREFTILHPAAAEPLRHWANIVNETAWNNPGELKQAFDSADFYGALTIFDVGGNKYRLIGFVHYRWQIVFIKWILTHTEYGKGKWQT